MMYQLHLKKENQELLMAHLNWLKEAGLINDFEKMDATEVETKDYLTKVIETSERDFKSGKSIFK